MKILLLTHHFQTPEEPGAPRPYQFAKHMAEKGHRLTVITAGTQYLTGQLHSSVNDNFWSVEEIDHGIKVIRTKAMSDYRGSFIRRILSYFIFSFLALLAGLKQQADLVYVGTTPPTITVTGYILSKVKRSKFVMEVRELFPEEAVELGYIKNQFLISTFEGYQNFFRRRADKLIALTPGIKKILMDKGFRESHISVNTNAYDQGNDNQVESISRTEVRQELGWEESFIVLYTGGFGEVNDLTTLLKAARLLKKENSIKFYLIGDGEKKEEYEDFCKRHQVDSCYFLGAKPKQDLPRYYVAADVCIQLTPEGEFWECVLANKIFDYLGSGCPVIYAGQGDTGDLIQKANAGIVVESRNESDLVQAIKKLYDNPEDCKKLGEQGRDFILERYTRINKMSELESILAKLENYRY